MGNLTSFLNYANQYTKPFNEVTGVVAELQATFASARRGFELLDEADERETGDRTPAAADGDIDIEDVSFSYTDRPLIENFNLSVPAGSRVAIVGPTGAGKTTMVKLLMRFYDVDAGAITLSGRNVRDFDRSALREGFGMVLQDTWLFQGTIMENIRYGRLDATDEECRAAAKLANADEFIRHLPDGYNTTLTGDGTNLSQGQRQLLAIARAAGAGRGHLLHSLLLFAGRGGPFRQQGCRDLQGRAGAGTRHCAGLQPAPAGKPRTQKVAPYPVLQRTGYFFA